MLEILISSTVLILVICGIRVFWKGRINLHFQYALWLLVVIRLFPLGLFIDTDIPKVESPVSIMNSFEHLYKILPNLSNNAAVDHGVEPNSTNATSESTGEDNSHKQNASILSNAKVILHKNLEHLKRITTTIWYLGMILSAIWFIYVNINFQRTIRKERRLLRNVDCKLPVYVSTTIDTPMLLMVRGRFGIYVTPACEDNEVIMDHALTHELCHYKHFDYLWSFIRCILLIIYWFNPLVWLAANLSKRDCELSCDVSALKILGDKERIAYGRTILEFVSMQNNDNHIFNVATGMLESSSGMKERLQRILKKPKMMTVTCFGILVIVITITVITFTTAPNQESYGKSNNENLNTLLPENETAGTDEMASTDEMVSTDVMASTDNITPSTAPSNNELLNLLDGLNTQQPFNGYYYNGEKFMTPDGPIESLSDFTNEMVINKYFGISIWGEKDSLVTDGFSKSFRKLQGVYYWLSINASEECSIDIDYTTTATDTTLKTLLVSPDGNVSELKEGESNVITIPKGVSEIAIVAYDAVGDVTIKFNNLSEYVNVTKYEFSR